MLLSILIFLLIFLVIVVAHEFGHYAVAKRNGIRVNEFDIGMGPTLYSWQSGETMFCIKALPVGGACIFDGMNGLEAEDGACLDEHAYPNANVWSRMATTAAGPFANFILGFLFAVVIVAFAGTDIPVIREIMPDSAAEEAGLLPGDTIRKINGERIHLYREVSAISIFNYGTPLTIEFEREGEAYEDLLTPRYSEEDDRYYIGLIGSGEYKECKGFEVFSYGFYEACYWVKTTWKSIGQIFTGHFSKDDISGPVGVVKVVDDTLEQASPYGLPTVVLSFLNLATLLCINLGVVNLLPLPALDGGRLLLQIVEAFRGKPLPPEKEGMIHLAGFIALFILMIFVLFNDISRFFR